MLPKTRLYRSLPNQPTLVHNNRTNLEMDKKKAFAVIFSFSSVKCHVVLRLYTNRKVYYVNWERGWGG